MAAKPIDVVIPDIGDAEGVEVIELCVEPGASVALDDVLIVIESDKASMEIPAPFAGVLASFSVTLGEIVTTGQSVAQMTADDQEVDNDKVADEPEPADDPAPPPVPPDNNAQVRVEVRLPDIGDAGEVVVIELGVTAGETVAAEQMLLVVESDKASMDIVSPAAGVVTELLVGEGDDVTEGHLLVVVETTSDAVAPAPASSPKPTPIPDTATTTPAPQLDASDLAPPPTQTPAPEPPKTIYAGPAVRRRARELGVELARLTGTGARGRIVKDDLNNYVKAQLSAQAGGSASSGIGIPAIPTIDFSKFGETELRPLTRIQRRGAANLHRSWLNVVHVTQHAEADVTELENFRGSLKPEGERRGIKITPLAFLMKACAYLLREHPTFNSSLDATGENFILKHYVNIGFAVDTPDGLLVPVVRDAANKGVWDLAEEINLLAAKARDKKLAPNDLQGGTFTISSLGAIGGTGFTPIVNAPEVAILGVANLAMKPQWDGEQFIPRKMLPLSLSYDHRAINGAEAGRFATELCELLSDLRRVAL